MLLMYIYIYVYMHTKNDENNEWGNLVVPTTFQCR